MPGKLIGKSLLGLFQRCGCRILARLVALLLLAVLSIALITGCALPEQPPGAETSGGQGEMAGSPSTGPGPGAVEDGSSDAGERKGVLRAHFLDVGQGDAIFLELPDGRVMLIDAGPNEAGTKVVSYLREHGVKRIDFLIATHPHADHIGGMDAVIRSFDIGAVYMPRVATGTKTFEEVLLALKEKGLKAKEAKSGVSVPVGEGLTAEFIAPRGSGYEDLNNWSSVLRVCYGDVALLFAGDAEADSEMEMLEAGVPLRADLLKVAHHGSSSSTTPRFLQAVRPKYAVISVGAGNDYGHPHKETLKNLEKAGVQVYRTDRCGTVVFRSDGRTLAVESREK